MTINKAKKQIRAYLEDADPDCPTPFDEALDLALEEIEKIKDGVWVKLPYGDRISKFRYKCSVCQGKHVDPQTGEWHEVFDFQYPYCPNCGAKLARSN